VSQVPLDGATLCEAVCASRAKWAGGGESSGAFQTDLGCRVDAEHRLTFVAGDDFDAERRYATLVDSYDLANNPVLSALRRTIEPRHRCVASLHDGGTCRYRYAARHAALMPPADAGCASRPTRPARCAASQHRASPVAGGRA
jgi:hypothetical protein